MYRRATALAVLALAGSPGVAAASTELNVIPHGQTQPGVSWATQPGMLPADAQARMYDRLTPFGANITDAMLAPSADGSGFFKSAALKPVDDPSYLTDETITATAGGTTLTAPDPARPLRRAEHLLGHRRRRDLRRRLRDRAGPQPAARPGARQRDRGRDRPPRRAGHQPHPRPLPVHADREGPQPGHQAAGQVARAGRQQGPPGPARHRHLPRRHQQVVRREPAGRAAVRPRRHLRAQRGQGAVPRPGRRRGGPERDVPRRRARQVREGQGLRRLRGPAPAQRSRDVDHDRAQGRRSTRTSRSSSRRGSCGSRRAASGPPASGSRAAPRRHRRSRGATSRRTSCWSTGRAPRPARRSWSAVRRSATTTPA